MTNKSIYLVCFRLKTNQRAHFALYLPNNGFPGSGTKVHVVGAPMTGFHLEIREQYSLADTGQPYTSFALGQVSAADVANVLNLASTVRPPPISQNFMAPVDGVSFGVACVTSLTRHF